MQTLLFVHIPSANDAEMTRLEQEVNGLRAQVDGCLQSVRESGRASPPLLDAAAQSWEAYEHLAAEVVRLSRENSNVVSTDVSIHDKRQATKDCLSALSALSAAIDVGPRSSR